MEFGSVIYESKDRVATITLNRPERLNAISVSLPEDIADAFNHATADDSVQVVVLTGSGRGFCSGYDLKSFAKFKIFNVPSKLILIVSKGSFW